jgi:hypothetical protein
MEPVSPPPDPDQAYEARPPVDGIELLGDEPRPAVDAGAQSAAGPAGPSATSPPGRTRPPIRGVAFVPASKLTALWFNDRFAELATAGFPGAGAYMGPKSAIGL